MSCDDLVELVLRGPRRVRVADGQECAQDRIAQSCRDARAAEQRLLLFRRGRRQRDDPGTLALLGGPTPRILPDRIGQNKPLLDAGEAGSDQGGQGEEQGFAEASDGLSSMFACEAPSSGEDGT